MKKKLILASVKLLVLLTMARLFYWKGLQRKALVGFSATLNRALGITFSAESMCIHFHGKITAKQLSVTYKNISGTIGFASLKCGLISLLKKKLQIYAVLNNTVIDSLSMTADKIHFSHLSCNLHGIFTRNSILIQDNSIATFNFLQCKVGLQYIAARKSFFLKLSGDHLAATDMLRSFPDFACRDIYAMDYSGFLSFEMSGGYYANDMAKNYLDLVFDPAELVISNKTNTVFNCLKEPFVHAVYENGKFKKSIDLSGNNPGFLAFNNTPEQLYKIILHTEDPNFFLHKGVDRFFIGYALLQNIQQRRIVRGGSTVTMQLVRNLYLGHKRSIYKKLEEIVIAWLLEVVFGVPKTRILEIYLNIIEFAPGIYGIREACWYYFEKLPAELSITECLVLSYIIPRPKHFDDALNGGSEQLRVNLKKHLDRVSNALLFKKIITQHEFASIEFVFPIRGKLLSLADAFAR